MVDSHRVAWHCPYPPTRARQICGHRLWQDNNERESDYAGAGTVDEAIVVVVFVTGSEARIAIAATPRVAGVVCVYLTCLANYLVLSSTKVNVDTRIGFGVRQCKSDALYHDERMGDLGGRWCHSEFQMADEKLR